MNYEKDLERNLIDVELARFNDNEFVYQVWENDEEIEVDVVAETYLDAENNTHREHTTVEGKVEELDEDRYIWSPTGINSEEATVSVVSYDKGFQPTYETPGSLNEVAELERVLESSFNNKEITH